METSFRGTNESTSAGDSVLGTESPSAYEIQRINFIIKFFIQNKHTYTTIINIQHTYKHTYNVWLVTRKPCLLVVVAERKEEAQEPPEPIEL